MAKTTRAPTSGAPTNYFICFFKRTLISLLLSTLPILSFADEDTSDTTVTPPASISQYQQMVNDAYKQAMKGAPPPPQQIQQPVASQPTATGNALSPGVNPAAPTITAPTSEPFKQPANPWVKPNPWANQPNPWKAPTPPTTPGNAAIPSSASEGTVPGASSMPSGNLYLPPSTTIAPPPTTKP